MTTEKNPDEIYAAFGYSVYYEGSWSRNPDVEMISPLKYHSDAKYTRLLEENEKLRLDCKRLAVLLCGLEEGEPWTRYHEVDDLCKTLESRGKK